MKPSSDVEHDHDEPQTIVQLIPLPPFQPDLIQRAWMSTPHPTLPLLATAHGRAVTVFSLVTMEKHSALTDGHERAVRTVAWKPGLSPHRLCLLTGSFDSTAAVWRWGREGEEEGEEDEDGGRVEEIKGKGRRSGNDGGSEDQDDDDWKLEVVLEGHEKEIKTVAFSPSGQLVATAGRDMQVWVWEDVGAREGDDDWETAAVLDEHTADIKSVAWCPACPGRDRRIGGDMLASAGYDDTVRLWREDPADGDWTCVAVLEGHSGTVWGLQWEPAPRGHRFPRLLSFSADTTVRVWSLHEEEEEEEEASREGTDGERQEGTEAGGNSLWSAFRSGGGGVPNRMRRSLREDWVCEAILPQVHSLDVYSVAWSATSGLVASTGADGVIAVYREEEEQDSNEQQEHAHMVSAGAATSTITPTTTTTTTTTTIATSEGEEQQKQKQQQRQGQQLSPENGDSHESHVPDYGDNSNGNGNSSSSKSKSNSRRQWRLLTTVSNGHGPYEINHVIWCKRYDPGTQQRGIEEMLVTTGDDGIVRPWQVLTNT